MIGAIDPATAYELTKRDPATLTFCEREAALSSLALANEGLAFDLDGAEICAAHYYDAGDEEMYRRWRERVRFLVSVRCELTGKISAFLGCSQTPDLSQEDFDPFENE
jgi:hypothetical protein